MKSNEKEEQPRKRAFAATILEIKNNAYQRGVLLTDNDIAQTLNLTSEQFDHLYKEDNAPDEVFLTLNAQYGEFIKRVIFRMSKTESIELPGPGEEE